MPDPRDWNLARGRSVRLDRPRIMAVLNVTPDSFFDGSRASGVEAGLAAAAKFLSQGADVLDIGGESTRPGAQRVSATEQIARVVPLISAIRASGGRLGEIPISVDTTRAEVALAAISAGADAINDVSGATEDPGMLDVAARAGCGLILMHRFRPPDADSYSDRYASPPREGEVTAEVVGWLADAAARAERAGVSPHCIMLDPGLGFGKTVEQNLELIRETPRLCKIGYPVLSALSRKSFIGRVSLDRDSTPDERLAGTIVFSIRHVERGASMVRVHDVDEHVAALRAWQALGGRRSVPREGDGGGLLSGG